MLMKNNKRGYVFPLILLATLSIGFFIVTLIQLQTSHRDQLKHLNTYQHSLNVAYSVYIDLLAELKEKQWDKRFFKGKPVIRANKNLFGSIYDSCIEDYCPASFTFNIKVRTTTAGKKHMFYWRLKYVPNMLDFTNFVIPIIFEEFSEDLFDQAKKSTVDAQIDNLIKAFKAKQSIANAISERLRKKSSVKDILLDLGAAQSSEVPLIETPDKPRVIPNKIALAESTQKKNEVAKIVNELEELIDDVDKLKYPASGKVITNGGSLHFRDGAWGNIIGFFVTGTSLNVLSLQGDWFEVNSGGTIGFVHKNFVSTPGHIPSVQQPPIPPGVAH